MLRILDNVRRILRYVSQPLFHPMEFMVGVFGGITAAFRRATRKLASPIKAIPSFTTELRHSRRWIDLILGLPSVLALLLVGFAVLNSRINTSEEASWYRRLADEAIKNGDFKDANIYLQRLVSMPNQRDRAQLGLASVLESQGEIERAQMLLRVLAPSDSHGLPEAHRSRALMMSDSINEETEASLLREFRWHLDHAGDRSSLDIRRGWANYYLASGDRKRAIRLFEDLRHDFPEITSKLARLYLLDGQESVAKVYFADALDNYKTVLLTEPENTDARVDAIGHQLQLGLIDEAVQTIEQGMRLDPDGPFKKIMAEVQVVVHDAMAQSSRNGAKSTLSQNLSQLRKALSYDPNCGIAIERLVAYSDADVNGSKTLKEIFSEAIAQGDEPALAHFAMAIVLWKEGKLNQALWHLETSHGYAPDLPFVANNLAWLLITRESPNYARALQLVTRAIDSAPSDPRYRDTRGTIYLRQEKWSQAIHDLEIALKSTKNRVPIHKKLERAYEGLGNDFMADAHREMQKKLGSQSDDET